MPYASSALLDPHAREGEAQLLVDLVRLSPLTLLLAESGADKSGFLDSSVMPLLLATPQARETEICVLFDKWTVPPLPALLGQIRKAIPVLNARHADEKSPSASLAATLARWQHGLDASFIIVLDRFEEHLAAQDRPGAPEFEEELVRVLNTPELRAHFVIAVDEDAAPLLEPLRARIPGFGDALVRLPRSAARPVPPATSRKPAEEAQIQPLLGSRPSQEALTGSAPGEAAAAAPLDVVPVTATAHAAMDSAPVREAVPQIAPAEPRIPPAAAEVPHTRPAALDPERRLPFAAASYAPSRLPGAAWAVLGMLLVASLCLLLLTLWQPRPRPVETRPLTPLPAADAESPTPPSQDTEIVAEAAPMASPADDQTPLPLIKDEVPRLEVASAAPERPTPPKPAPPPANVAPRPMAMVYVHVRSEAQRAWAEQLVQPLARRGVRVAGIKVVSVGPEASDLRYFRRQEAGEAARVARALREVGVPPPRLKRVSGFESSSTPRQYELWLPPGNPKRR